MASDHSTDDTWDVLSDVSPIPGEWERTSLSSLPFASPSATSRAPQQNDADILEARLSLISIEDEDEEEEGRQVSRNNRRFGLSPLPNTSSHVNTGRKIPSAYQRLHDASCALCEEVIRCERWICKDCPAWNVCGMCIKMVMCDHEIHPQHTLIRIMLPVDIVQTMPQYWDIREQRYVPSIGPVIHVGATCSICEQSIIGVRYECAVKRCRAEGVLFCQDCEALPINDHPASHPLLKYKLCVDESVKVPISSLGNAMEEVNVEQKKQARKKTKHSQRAH